MKFLIDAHLPRRMVGWFAAAGCQATHTLDLPLGNRTPDNDVTKIADQDGRVLVTKDGDFVDSHLLHGQPAKLLLVTTGNISNWALELLMVPLMPRIVVDFQQHSFLELGQSGIIIRG
jgi:predicted nuclease of predicted toxin-antitoxin system